MYIYYHSQDILLTTAEPLQWKTGLDLHLFGDKNARTSSLQWDVLFVDYIRICDDLQLSAHAHS